MATVSELFTKLDPDPRLRGKQFERVAKWFLETDRAYQAQLKRVWLWDEWPERWGGDAGIDLVGKTHSGDLWAIQVKCYNPEYSITKKDVDTFLSESSRSKFGYRLLIATTNRIGATARRTLDAQEKPVGLLMLGDLERAEVEWPISPVALRGAVPKPKKPRPHQELAVGDVVNGFKSADRGQLIMACGTGKTLAGLFIAEALNSKRTLILLPSLSLLAQTLREWTANATVPFSFLPVCSDVTVRGEEDQLVASPTELGFPVTTDPEVIASFLRGRGPRIVFSTYQSSSQVAEAFIRGRVPAFDLAIADEAHRCAGPVSGAFATILNPDQIKARRRLFMTATPRYFTGRLRKQAREADFEVASMDDKPRFGPVFHRLSFGEAIDRNLLSDYQVVIVGVDDPTYRAYAEDGTFVTTDGKEVTDARTLASHIGLAKAMKKYDLRRAITFHGRVKRARDFANDFPGVVEWMPRRKRPRGTLWTDHVSGEMSSGQRDVRLDRLRHLDDGERGLLSNARCLAEGVDVPTLDGVAFVDPRRSQVDIVQAVGRAIRKADDKTVGTIVLPVFIGASDDADAALDDSAFKPVWDVLRALRAHDDKLGEELDTLRREIGLRSVAPARPPEKVTFDLPVTIDRRFAEAFRTHLVEESTSSWEFWFGLLQRYVAREGTALVPARHKEAGHALGTWVNRQRVQYLDGNLLRDHLEALNQIEGWIWQPWDDAWEASYLVVRNLVERKGNALIGRDEKVGDFNVGQWVANQRRHYRKRTLSDERIAKLNSIRGWAWNAKMARWEEGFLALTGYLEEDETRSARYVPKFTKKGFPLGNWVNRQRINYRNGELSQGPIRRLEGIEGWSWNPQQEDWEAAYEVLRAYVERTGDALVHQHHKEGGFALGSWVSNQRKRYRSGKLPAEYVRKLEEIVGWSWDPEQDRFNTRFDLLLKYCRREGHSQVPATHVEGGVPLGQWVSRQRSEYRRRRMPPDRIRLFDEIPEWTWEVRRGRTPKSPAEPRMKESR